MPELRSRSAHKGRTSTETSLPHRRPGNIWCCCVESDECERNGRDQYRPLSNDTVARRQHDEVVPREDRLQPVLPAAKQCAEGMLRVGPSSEVLVSCRGRRSRASASGARRMRPKLGLRERRTQVEEHCPLARGVSFHGQDDVVEGDAPGRGVAPIQRDIDLATVERIP